MDFPPSLRAVSVLFVDIRDYTPLATRLAPRGLTTLLDRYYGATSQALFHHDAVIEFAGDAVMGLFNAPIPRDDHERVALTAALEIQRTVGGLGIPDLTVGIGVNSGEGIVGLMTKGEVRDFTAVGDVVNVAARLQAKARAGEIVASEQVVERARDLVPEQYVMEKVVFELKGKEEPCPAWVLRNRSSNPASPAAER